MREIADEAVTASKTARRQRERRLRVIQGGQSKSRSGKAQLEIVESGPANEKPPIEIFPFEEWS